ncbi:MAG: phage terminase small subunit P27 family [Proteobacteria bacterium]|nr:phage terminase small subunit P27 family [Pseudomonadota bacterium]
MRGTVQKSNAAKALTGGHVNNAPEPPDPARFPGRKTMADMMGYQPINPETGNAKEAEASRAFRCPSWMPKHGKEFWGKYARTLMDMGVLTEVDRATFEALCLSYALMREAAEQMVSEGPVVPHERGGVKKNPAFTVYKENVEQFRKLAESFGLSPLSRQRLDVKEPQPETNSPWDKL